MNKTTFKPPEWKNKQICISSSSNQVQQLLQYLGISRFSNQFRSKLVDLQNGLNILAFRLLERVGAGRGRKKERDSLLSLPVIQSKGGGHFAARGLYHLGEGEFIKGDLSIV